MSVIHVQSPTPIEIANGLKSEPTPPPINDHVQLMKRQRYQREPQSTDNIVHVTVTESGTVVYTYTATSYSYIPTYSTIVENNSTSSNNNNNNNNSSSGQGNGANGASSSGPNIGAIVGGVVGGIAFIALIGLIFFFVKRSQKKKKMVTGFDTEASYHDDMQTASKTNIGNNGPRPFVAPQPFHQDDPEGGGGYYEDMVTTSYPGTHYNTPAHTATTDSLSSGNFAAYNSSQQYVYQVPNEIDYPNTQMQERHVPHLKENEPPHLKD